MNLLMFGVPVIIIRSKRRRRSIAIRVESEQILVFVPHTTSDDYINRILKEKTNWIEHHVKNNMTIKPILPWYEESRYFLGESLRIQYTSNTLKHAWSFNAQAPHLQISGPARSVASPETKVMYQRWLQDTAKSVLSERLNRWSQRLSLSYNQVRYKDMKSRWGSCSAKQNINLNWRLIQAPTEVIDYVIVHELCHLVELNHSTRFWNLVEQAIPDFKKSKLWLKQNGNRLYF